MTREKYKAVGEVSPLKDITPDWFQTYSYLSENKDYHILLESGRGGRYSIIGLDPWAVLRGKDHLLTVQTADGEEQLEGPLLLSLRKWLEPLSVKPDPSLPEFQGGLIGQFSYDLIREIESLPAQAADDLQTDDVCLLAFHEVTVIDHKKDEIWFIAVVPKEENDAAHRPVLLKEKWMNAGKNAGHHYIPVKKTEEQPDREVLERSFPEEEFKKAVEKTKYYIREGDVFQVNLSVRETRPLYTEPLHIYSCLRRVNPSPYMGYMATPELQYVSASPELLVKVKGEEISTRPIAGTRSRGKDDEEDQALADTLLNNEKERAEHIMLVDLERNDLGRVSEYGSVEVDELMVIEKYSHVMHIVSNVKGKKADNYDALDVISATFPGGTITGAPKIRTMEIIEELEPVRRGAYTGSFGWIGFQGDMELNITIRTMVIKDGKAHVQAGAGIVIDSDPKAEYKESLKKAKALWKAKEMSEEELRRKIL
ncbi:anthranilate synthase component I family protein [Salipaludibacillus sp. CUR1]|uniref:anthranilate synthase component I family protein n=1 Tax=Salipaludibacillus sp. CUR1 TaxID=2820003 RepID=UPI001E334207|nr:anthranilate synthase component I family protein [Salipaludibacillus sp. CUR1]MCE7791277.1 anthranilate synthase component I family protein [Salipaludibacillus sp. CUR1]